METYPERQGFLGLEKPHCDFEKAKIVVIPMNFLQCGDTCRGPRKIIEESKKVQVFGDDFKKDIFRDLGIATLNTMPRFLPPFNDFTISKIQREMVSRVLDFGKIPITIGSENMASNLSADVVCSHFSDVVFLRFDSRLNIKSVEPGGVIGDDTAFWCLIERFKKSLFVGIRSVCPEEIEVLKRYRPEGGAFEEEKIHVFRVRKNIRGIGGTDFRTFLRNLRVLLKGRKVYFSFHLSVMDTSAIGFDTTYFEPGGFFYDECLDIFDSVFTELDIVGADFTGVSPNGPFYNFRLSPTLYVTAKIISRFIARLKI